MAATCLSDGARLLGSWKNVEVHISQPPQLALLSLLWFCLTLSRRVWGDDDARWNASVRTALKQRANNVRLVSERERQTDKQRAEKWNQICISVYTLGDMLANGKMEKCPILVCSSLLGYISITVKGFHKFIFNV